MSIDIGFDICHIGYCLYLDIGLLDFIVMTAFEEEQYEDQFEEHAHAVAYCVGCIWRSMCRIKELSNVGFIQGSKNSVIIFYTLMKEVYINVKSIYLIV